MTTSINLKRILDRKQWEIVSLCPSGTAVGSFAFSSKLPDKTVYFFVSASTVWAYRPDEDAWQQLQSPGAGGTFGAGSCGTFHPMRCGADTNATTDTATGGSTTTINTTINAKRSCTGFTVRIVSGPGAGEERTILSNTIGANSTITVDTPFSTAITSSSKFQLITGSIYFWNAGTMSSSSFRRYDYITDAWSSLSVTSAPTSWGTEGKIENTRGSAANFVTGTATNGGAITLENSAKNWATNQWANFQLRIIAGTGAGQIRTIASNTATIITLTAVWTIAPDNTSEYVIEGHDDYLYLTGNASTTFYRYAISTNTWSTLTARPAAPGTGMGLAWIVEQTDSTWTDESAYLNGRRIYAPRGGGSAVIDYYDIPSNTWTTLSYANQFETFTTGSAYVNTGGIIYIQKDATGRWYQFDTAKNELLPWSYNWYGQSTAHQGDRGVLVTYEDGATTLKWIMAPGNNQTIWHRCLIF